MKEKEFTEKVEAKLIKRKVDKNLLMIFQPPEQIKFFCHKQNIGKIEVNLKQLLI